MTAIPPARSIPANSQWGDARSGKLADNLSGFGRALRRAGVRVDAARMALAQQAVLLAGLQRQDFSAALEAVLVSGEQDRMVFRELFDAYFRNPDIAQKLLAQMLPSAESKAAPNRHPPPLTHPLLPRRMEPKGLAGGGASRFHPASGQRIPAGRAPGPRHPAAAAALRRPQAAAGRAWQPPALARRHAAR